MSSKLKPLIPVAILYESDTFIVVGPESGSPPGEWTFEVVRKVQGTTDAQGVFLFGHAAHAFGQKIKQWQEATPQQSDVEAFLDGLTQLGLQPLVMH